MSYFLLGIFWLIVALFMGVVISYADRIRNLHRIGLSFILISFSIGIAIMVYAITNLT